MSVRSPTPQTHLDNFEDRPLVMILLGENARISVWLSDDVQTPNQTQWALDQLATARDELIKMRGGPSEATN